MNQEERRKYPRVKILYPITYACLDSDGLVTEERMAVAVDISQSGVLLESASIVTSKHVQLISVDLDEKIIENTGKIAYCRRTEKSKYRIGIAFGGTHDTNIDFASRIIRAYHHLKKTLKPAKVQRPASHLIQLGL